jgi:phosphatidate cytidylyltransferase
MHLLADRDLARLLSGLLVALAAATVVGHALERRPDAASRRALLDNLNARITSWWVMSGIVLFAALLGRTTTIALFGALSFLALREFLALVPTRRGDHRALLLMFFVAVPLQYALVVFEWYGLFAVFLPVLGALGVSAACALAGDTERFAGRTGELLLALMICVYALSHVPALLMLEIPRFAGPNVKLLLFLIVVVEASDVLQYIWGKLAGRRPIAPGVSPAKTWEGFVGGVLSATLLGAALWRLTPFAPWQAAALSLVATIAGVAGGLVMSAIKRDRGVKDFGAAIAGHGGVLDRIDSLCFAGPVFFHLTRYYFAA